MTNRAALSQSFVLEDKRPRLLSMTLRAGLIEPRQGQPAGRFQNITAMRVVALHAIHPAFNNWMMLRQVKLGVRLQMTLKTSRRVLAGIDDKFAPAPSCLDVF